jgi:hypothetical protein
MMMSGRGLARLSATIGLAALAILGALPVVSGPIGATDNSSTVADTVTSSAPPSTPTIPSAAPSIKATPFQGGDWPNG